MDTPQKVYSEMVASLIEVGLNIVPVPLTWEEYHAKVNEPSSTRGIALAGFYGMYRDPYAFFGPALAPMIAEQQVRGDGEDRRATLFKRCGFKYSDSGDAESAAELLAGSGEPGGIRLRFALPHPHAFGHGRSRGGIPELPEDYGEHPRRGLGRVGGCAA